MSNPNLNAATVDTPSKKVGADRRGGPPLRGKCSGLGDNAEKGRARASSLCRLD